MTDTTNTAADRIDFADDATSVDAVDEALNTTFKGLPLSYSPAAKAASFRYGMHMMGLGPDDYYSNGTYAGMTDDAAVVIMCSLCSADAGNDPDCPDELRSMLLRRTLSFKQSKLADCLLRFFDAFDVDPMDSDIYELGFGLMGLVDDTTPEPDAEGVPGK